MQSKDGHGVNLSTRSTLLLVGWACMRNVWPVVPHHNGRMQRANRVGRVSGTPHLARRTTPFFVVVLAELRDDAVPVSCLTMGQTSWPRCPGDSNPSQYVLHVIRLYRSDLAPKQCDVSPRRTRQDGAVAPRHIGLHIVHGPWQT